MAQKVDINTATIDELARLQGIGEKLAERIIEYRQTVHSFEEVIELAAVPGISERMVREIEGQLTVGAQPPPESPAAESPVAQAEAVTQPPDAEPVTAEAPAETVEQTALMPVPLPAAAPESTDEPETTPRATSAWWSHLLSALGGALLALLALLLLNGTLEFTGANRAADLQRQADQQRLEQSRLRNEFETMSDRLATVDAAQAGLQDQVRSLDGDVQTLQEQLQESVSALQDDTEQLSQRLEGVAQAADNFDVFLDGMRDLLITLQGLPPTSTITATPTSTPDLATSTPAGESETTPSPTAAGATRTPRPTATPIVPTTPGASP